MCLSMGRSRFTASRIEIALRAGADLRSEFWISRATAERHRNGMIDSVAIRTLAQFILQRSAKFAGLRESTNSASHGRSVSICMARARHTTNGSSRNALRSRPHPRYAGSRQTPWRRRASISPTYPISTSIVASARPSRSPAMSLGSARSIRAA